MRVIGSIFNHKLSLNKKIVYIFYHIFSYILSLLKFIPFIPCSIFRSLSSKLLPNYMLISILTLFIFTMPLANFSANAQQELLFDEQIKAYAITRFWQGFTEYEVRLLWSAFEWEMADQYKIFKSSNEGDFEEIEAEYEHEGFQFWWIDKEVMDRNNYRYYVEGYQLNEFVGRTEEVYVDFWLPPCPALYPVNNEIVQEEEPVFKWQSIALTTFPFKNVIFSARGEFLVHDLTEDEEIWRVSLEDINATQITFNKDEAAKPLTKKHQYQWQLKITGYDALNQAIAESITGGLFGFQEKAEEMEPTEEEEEEEEELVAGGLTISADFLSYQVIEGEDVVEARDNVRLRYEDINLKANYLQIMLDRNEFIAKEQVLFNIGEESYSCQALNYNWKTDKIIMDEFSGETTGENIRGMVYYEGGKLENFPDTIAIDSGVFTTCDLENPHWHIEAEEITIYVDDKIIAKKVSWYEGDRKMFTLPSFLIFLRGKNQLPYIPQVGQSSSEGWFLKNQINYVQDESSYGSLYLDLMQQKGLAAGIEHTFELGEKAIDDGEVVLYLYGLKRKAANIYDLDASINYWQNFEHDLRLKANIIYDGTIYPAATQNSSHIIKPDFYLYKKWEDALLTLTGKYNFNVKSSSTTSTGNIKMVYDNTLTDELSSHLVLMYNSQDSTDQPIDQWLRPEWQLKYAGQGYTLSLVTEKLFELQDNILGVGTSSVSTLDRIPEFIFTKSSSEFMDTGIIYSINASVGNYYESATDQQNIRGEYIINANRPFKITDNISLNASGIYRQDVYLSGEARYLLGSKLDLKVGYQPEFYGNFSYNYYMSEGPTPFNFDLLSPLNEYASASIVLKPRDDLQINLATNYNFVSESFGSLGARLQWEPKGEHDIYLSSYYDLNKREWNKRIDTRMSLKLSEEWKMSYSGSLYFDDFDIRNSVISVVKDLHCREISINYKQSTKSIWVDFSIKAFPTETITVGG
ncbi:MAG TPA: hypothetical protein DEG96_08720 [Candidatus Atribacteria bacterium]|nr:hypothetical protein [Candidatus Atribacteria bacterium]